MRYLVTWAEFFLYKLGLAQVTITYVYIINTQASTSHNKHKPPVNQTTLAHINSRSIQNYIKFNNISSVS